MGQVLGFSFDFDFQTQPAVLFVAALQELTLLFSNSFLFDVNNFACAFTYFFERENYLEKEHILEALIKG